MRWLFLFVSGCLRSHANLAAENVALRQQLAVLRRSVKRPKLTRSDRLFWTVLQRIWPGWRGALLLVKPDTVLRWHRSGFKLFWRWKSRKLGRPRVDPEIRNLVRKMAIENPTWGAPRILGELRKLGFNVSETTVAKYMPKVEKPSSPTWRSFLTNHSHKICACDFFVVPTLTFGLLYVFVALSHERRRIDRVNVTQRPTAEWTGQQLREAFPWDTAPKYLIRDNDGIYGHDFTRIVEAIGINEVKTAPGSPWQNAYCERVIGTLRRECTDHIIPLSEKNLLRVLNECVAYYNSSRTHLSLDKDAPEHRPTQSPADSDNIISIPVLGGLHHRYERVPSRNAA